ncbi:hypothetical protein ACX9I7_10130 [Streptomyces sp. L500]
MTLRRAVATALARLAPCERPRPGHRRACTQDQKTTTAAITAIKEKQ